MTYGTMCQYRVVSPIQAVYRVVTLKVYAKQSISECVVVYMHMQCRNTIPHAEIHHIEESAICLDVHVFVFVSCFDF